MTEPTLNDLTIDPAPGAVRVRCLTCGTCGATISHRLRWCLILDDAVGEYQVKYACSVRCLRALAAPMWSAMLRASRPAGRGER